MKVSTLLTPNVSRATYTVSPKDSYTKYDLKNKHNAKLFNLLETPNHCCLYVW